MRALGTFFVACLFCVCSAARADTVSPWARLADPVLVGVEPAGLSHPRVDSLAQDSAGFLWIGTQTGLARFDGYRAQLFTADPSNARALPEGDIRTLLADPRGALWIGTSASGLVRFDEATEAFTTWRANSKAGNGPRSANVVAMAMAGNGRLWIGGDAGLDLFDPNTQRFTPIDLAPRTQLQPRIEALRVDSRGTVWVATLRGLFYRPLHQQHFRLWERPGSSETAQTSFFSICEDHDGRVWIGSLDELVVLNGKQQLIRTIRSSEDPASLSHGEQWAIAEPNAGTIWAGSNNGEVSIIDTKSGTIRRIDANAVTSKGRSGGAVWQFFQDRFGLLWIGDGFGGLSFYNTRSRGIYNLALTKPKLGSDDQGAIALTATPKGDLWVGGSRGSLIELDPRRGAIRKLSTLNSLPVNALSAQPDGTLWVGTDANLCRLDTTDAQCPWPPFAHIRRVSALAQTPATLWVGTGAGLYVLHANGTIDAFHQGSGSRALTNDDMYVVYPDRGGHVWVGAVNGLDQIDPISRTVTHYVHEFNDPNSLGLGEIISILQDRGGRIWATGPGGPVNVSFVRNGRIAFQHVLDEDGQPLQDATGLAQDARGRVWASLSNAVAVIDPVTLRARKLGPADGVPDDDYEVGIAARAPDGTIFFGRQNGVTVISSQANGPGAAANAVAPVVITSSKVADKERPPWPFNQGQTIDVPAERRDVSVGFSALDFARSAGLRYEYQLRGYDHSWMQADPAYRLATYTNLSPGTYTLEIRALDPSSGLSLGQIAIPLVVQARWYETWWFRSLLALLVAIALYAAYRVSTAVYRQRQRQLEAIVADRTSALRQANEKLEEMSVTDALTGLHNRRYLESQIEADVAMSVRRYEDANRQGTRAPEDADLIFFLLDVDHFKTINDRYGHRSGDLVLTQMRERLSEVFRESDFIIRWGGDEFLAVARATNRRDGSDIAERICRAMNDRPFRLEGGEAYTVAGSVGFAAFPFLPSDPRALTWKQIVTIADHALYIAKDSGRANWTGIAGTMQTNPVELERQLAKAVIGAMNTSDLQIVSRATVV